MKRDREQQQLFLKDSILFWSLALNAFWLAFAFGMSR